MRKTGQNKEFWKHASDQVVGQIFFPSITSVDDYKLEFTEVSGGSTCAHVWPLPVCTRVSPKHTVSDMACIVKLHKGMAVFSRQQYFCPCRVLDTLGRCSGMNCLQAINEQLEKLPEEAFYSVNEEVFYKVSHADVSTAALCIDVIHAPFKHEWSQPLLCLRLIFEAQSEEKLLAKKIGRGTPGVMPVRQNLMEKHFKNWIAQCIETFDEQAS